MDEFEKSFQALKDRLTSSQILTLLEGNDGFVIYYDVSSTGLGYILMQHDKMIVYAIRQLKVHEKSYPNYDRELLVVVLGLMILQHHLYEVHIDVFTDHKSLQHMFT